jgi:hypothetical protein
VRLREVTRSLTSVTGRYPIDVGSSRAPADGVASTDRLGWHPSAKCSSFASLPPMDQFGVERRGSRPKAGPSSTTVASSQEAETSKPSYGLTWVVGYAEDQNPAGALEFAVPTTSVVAVVVAEHA